MATVANGAAHLPRLSAGIKEQLLGAQLGITVDSPDYRDTITVCVCGGVYGLTAIMLVYAWCNYRYRPIRAKNLPLTTLIYISTVLWYIGNIPSNGHVQVVGAWSKCKVWVVWFRIFFCFVFASMTIARLYALDRVFNQKKPFTAWSGLIALAVVVAGSGVVCLVYQLVSDDLTVGYDDFFEFCNTQMGVNISAIVFQWVQWAGCGYLVFRLRNIQSSFNEFRESIAIFAVIIALLTETSVTNLYYKYYIFEQPRRIEKTVMDTLASNLVIWLMIGYPVIMSVFRRHTYEQQWVDRLSKDGPSNSYAFKAKPKRNSSYSKMHDNSELAYGHGDGTFGSSDMIHTTLTGGQHTFSTGFPFTMESAFDATGTYVDNRLHISGRPNIHIHDGPVMASPAALVSGFAEPTPDGRFVL